MANLAVTKVPKLFLRLDDKFFAVKVGTRVASHALRGEAISAQWTLLTRLCVSVPVLIQEADWEVVAELYGVFEEKTDTCLCKLDELHLNI